MLAVYKQSKQTYFSETLHLRICVSWIALINWKDSTQTTKKYSLDSIRTNQKYSWNSIQYYWESTSYILMVNIIVFTFLPLRPDPEVTNLFSILSARWVQALDQIGCMSQEQCVTCSSTYHWKHGQPHVGQRLRRKPPVTDAQHVWHGFEQGPRILFGPTGVLHKQSRLDNCHIFVTLHHITTLISPILSQKMSTIGTPFDSFDWV